MSSIPRLQSAMKQKDAHFNNTAVRELSLMHTDAEICILDMITRRGGVFQNRDAPQHHVIFLYFV